MRHTIQGKAAGTPVRLERILRYPQSLSQRLGHKFLENDIHIQQQPGRPHCPSPGLKCGMTQNKPRQLHHPPVMFIQPVKGKLRDVSRRKLLQRNPVEHIRNPSQSPAGLRRAQPHTAQPVRCRFYQPVGKNIGGEFVILRFYRKGCPKPAPQLLLESDTPPHRRQCFFLYPVAVQQPAGKRPPGAGY